MGCGSLSTVAVQTSGTNLPTRDHNILRDTDNVNLNVYDNTDINESNKLSLGYFPLNTEYDTKKFKTSTANGKAEGSRGKISSNFKVFDRELDYEKHKLDDGGVWCGTEHADNDVTPGLERSLGTEVGGNEEASSTDIIKHRLDPNNEANSVCAEYATISFDNSPDLTHPLQQDKSQNEKPTKHEPSIPTFSQSSLKQLRHLQKHQIHFESLEDRFSNGYGHYIDEDKQMSDSELADYEFSDTRSRAKETTLRFNEGNIEFIAPRMPAGNEDLEGSQVDDSSNRQDSKENSPSYTNKVRKSKDTDFEKKNKISETLTATTGRSLEEFPTWVNNPFIPQFVFKCVNYIEEVGLKTEGLYRLCGNKSQADLFLNNYLADPKLDIAPLEIPVTVIASVLKNFFNDLKEALIPPKMYEDLVKTTEVVNKDSQLVMLGNIIKKLPPQNFEVFKYIITHLSRVAQHQEFNSMSSRNLAKCWWPTLIRLQFESYEKLVQEFQVLEDIVQIFIEQCSFIFYGESDV